MSAADEILPLRFPNKGTSSYHPMASMPQSAWEELPNILYGEHRYRTACGRFTLYKTDKSWQIIGNTHVTDLGVLDYEWRNWVADVGLDLAEFTTCKSAINALIDDLDYHYEPITIAV